MADHPLVLLDGQSSKRPVAQPAPAHDRTRVENEKFGQDRSVSVFDEPSFIELSSLNDGTQRLVHDTHAVPNRVIEQNPEHARIGMQAINELALTRVVHAQEIGIATDLFQNVLQSVGIMKDEPPALEIHASSKVAFRLRHARCDGAPDGTTDLRKRLTVAERQVEPAPRGHTFGPAPLEHVKVAPLNRFAVPYHDPKTTCREPYDEGQQNTDGE